MNVNDINLKFLTDNEVETLICKLHFEKEDRKNAKAQELWNNVIKAMQEYYVRVGPIKIDDDKQIRYCPIINIEKSAKTKGLFTKKWD